MCDIPHTAMYFTPGALETSCREAAFTRQTLSCAWEHSRDRHGSCPWGTKNEADFLHVVIELNEDWVKHRELQPNIKVWGSLACRSVGRGTPEAVTFEPGSEGWVRITQRKLMWKEPICRNMRKFVYNDMGSIGLDRQGHGNWQLFQTWALWF